MRLELREIIHVPDASRSFQYELDLSELDRYVEQNRPDVAVLTVPQSVAQSTADRLISLGVRGFWNFTNVELSSEMENVRFEDVHFADSLLTLSYRITDR